MWCLALWLQVHATLELLALMVVVFELCMKSRWLGLHTFVRHRRTMVKVTCPPPSLVAGSPPGASSLYLWPNWVLGTQGVAQSPASLGTPPSALVMPAQSWDSVLAHTGQWRHGSVVTSTLHVRPGGREGS